MPRRKGTFGQYGLHGGSKLAKRRRVEAENPGFKVCRMCGELVAEADVHPGSPKTPYCRPCALKRGRERYHKLPKPPARETSLARLFRRNAELRERGLFYCTGCRAELPLALKRLDTSKCGRCMDTRIAAWKKRKAARTRLTERQFSAGTEAARFGRRLWLAVVRVFRALGVAECRRHGWQETVDRRCGACLQLKALKRQKMLERRFVERVTIRELFVRSGGVCYLCGEKVIGKDATIDHVVPIAKGGEHSYANCRLAHRLCNSIKRDTGPLVAIEAASK